ncbi:MAG: hypothetical protein K2K56_07665 [Lachnospiraceae bacterium]|nr:hypothetical protein [Lachnospiraceae bacterium]
MNQTRKLKKQQDRERRKQIYDRVYELHQQADFLCYINDAYPEKYNGSTYIKLEGIVAKGTGKLEDTYLLFDCNGRQKAEITMEELYLENNSVKQLQGGDKRAALYPREQEVNYQAGDILCKLSDA